MKIESNQPNSLEAEFRNADKAVHKLVSASSYSADQKIQILSNTVLEMSNQLRTLVSEIDSADQSSRYFQAPGPRRKLRRR